MRVGYARFYCTFIISLFVCPLHTCGSIYNYYYIENESMLSGSAYGLSEQCTLLSACAESTIDGVCTRIRTGEMTLEEILLLKKKESHVEVLLSENEAEKADGEQLKQLLHQRFDELEEFRERVVLLGQVCQSVTVPVKG